MKRKRLGSLILVTLVAVISLFGPVVVAEAATGVSSYAELVAAIEAAVSGDVILIENDIDLADTIHLDKSLTLRVAGEEEVVLTTSSGYRHFRISGEEVHFTTEGVVLDGSGEAGGIRSDASHLVLNADIKNCVGTDIYANNPTLLSGGAIYVSDQKQLTVIGGKIQGNSTSHFGGGIYIGSDASLEIIDGQISDNSSQYGGGIFVGENTIALIEDVIISENIASLFGGGIYTNTNSVTTVNGGVITGNSAVGGTGGGIHAEFSTHDIISLTISGGEISNNYGFDGGGIYVNRNGSNISTAMLITGGKIVGNSGRYGGGVYAPNTIMTNGKITGNTATSDGGGIYVPANTASTFSMFGGEIENNSATRNGGGIWCKNLELLEVRDDSIVKNNISVQAYQMTALADITLHERQIDPTVTWTSGFEYIYNNNDVFYTKGTPIETPEPPAEHTVTLTEHWADDAQPDVVTTYHAENGDLLTISFTTPAGYTASAEVDSDVLVDYIAGTLTIPSVTVDRQLRLIYTPEEQIEGHTVTIVEHYLDDRLPDRVTTYTVPDGGSLVHDYEIHDNYAVYSSNMRMIPNYHVDEQDRTVVVENVNMDVTVTLNYYQAYFTITVTERYRDNALEENTTTYTVKKGADFFEHYDILPGYRVADILADALGFTVGYVDNSVSYESVQKDMRIVLVFDVEP